MDAAPPVVMEASATQPAVVPKLNMASNPGNLRFQVVSGGDITKHVTLHNVLPGETHVITAATQRQLFPQPADHDSIIGPIHQISISDKTHNHSGAPMCLNFDGLGHDESSHVSLKNTRAGSVSSDQIADQHHLVIPNTPYLAPNVHETTNVKLGSDVKTKMQEEVQRKYMWGSTDLNNLQTGVQVPQASVQLHKDNVPNYIVPTHIPVDNNGKLEMRPHPMATVLEKYEEQTKEKLQRGTAPFLSTPHMVGTIHVPSDVYTKVNDQLKKDVFSGQDDCRDIKVHVSSLGQTKNCAPSTVTLMLHAPRASFSVGNK